MKLVYVNTGYLDDISRIFNFFGEKYDQTKKYDKSTIFIVDRIEEELAIDLLSQGYKVIMSIIQEADYELLKTKIDVSNLRYLIGSNNPIKDPKCISIPLFFWYRESCAIEYSWQNLVRDYDVYDRKFLLMMNLYRPWRDTIYHQFSNIADQGLISYVEKGIRLDNDLKDISKRTWDRYINIEWYNRTQINIVSETSVYYHNDKVFLTEKTMKPLALKQPFVICGTKNSLATLQQAGFETFENLFDESYDSINDVDQRINFVYEQIKNYECRPYDKLTRDKLEHNYNLFYNKEHVQNRFRKEFLDQIEEFANE